jgi:hypothetical protein
MINLTTKLKAYPRMEPSILKDYYTKEETNTMLEGYVKEIEDPTENVIYGRGMVDGNIEWIDLPGMGLFVSFIISNNAGGSGEEDFPTIEDINSFADATKIDPSHYEIFYSPSGSGYLWLCSNKQISEIEFITRNNFLNTSESFQFVKEITIPVLNKNSDMIGTSKVYCYRTNVKYAATGASYNWKVTLV